MAKWWQERVVYQIYPRSFADTNGDGVGDIPGIIAHLDDIKDLGAGIIWLSPLYRSPDADNGYDISDYCDIDPKYGDMADMDRLIAEAQKRDIRLVMDLVINHTSDQHAWFQQSRDKSSHYRDYYIWQPPKKNGGPPNNWMSLFGGSAWTLDEQSGEYYLHLFAKEQPDLNYRNPKVLEEIKNVMRFWLNKGISGFRCDVINIIWKSSLADSKRLIKGSEYYVSQEGCHEILRTLRRDVLSRYDCFAVGETVFVTPEMGNDLCDEDRGELDMIFSFEHMETDQYFVKWFPRRFDAGRFGRTVARWQTALEWNANYLENHDQPRSVSRFGDDGQYWAESAKMLATMLLTLRGTPYLFEGQEIGMTNFDFASMEQLQDVESHNIYKLAAKLHLPKAYRWRMIKTKSRDNARTPMQWDASENGGFTTGTPWLGVNANHTRINVAAQKADPDSIRSYYKKLIALRASSALLKYGTFKRVASDRHLFCYDRKDNGKTYRVLLNFGAKPRRVPCDGAVVISSYGRKSYDGVLQPWEGVVIDKETES